MKPALNNTQANTNFDAAKQILSVSEASKILKISSSSLRRLEQEGKITSFRKENGYRFFNRKDIENLKFELDTKIKQRKEQFKLLPSPSTTPLAIAAHIEQPKTHNPVSTAEYIKTTAQKKTYAYSLPNINKAQVKLSILTAVCVISFLLLSYKINAMPKFMLSNILGTTMQEEYAMQGVLSALDRNAAWQFNLRIPANFTQNVTMLQNASVGGNFDVTGLATLNGGLITNNQDGDFGTGTITAAVLNFVGQATINNLSAIDTITEATLEEALDIDGDVQSTGLGNAEVIALRGNALGDTTAEDGNLLMAIDGNWETSPQTNITQLGTITTGEWQGTPVGLAYGGTGLSNFTSGDLLYANNSTTLATLGIGTNGYLLTSNGTYPTWAPFGANVVTSLTSANGGLILNSSTGPVNIELDTSTTGTTSTTATNSGLELTASGIRLVGGCTDTQILTWDATTQLWKCSTQSSGLSGNGVATRIAFWNGSSTVASSQNLYWDNLNSRLGIGNSSPTSSLSIGPNSEFQVSSTGDLARINNIPYVWPSLQATVNGQVLQNDGSGNLSWGSVVASDVASDSLDWAHFRDSMTLDANTTVNLYNGTAPGTIRFYDSSDATEAFFIDGLSNRIGMGTISPLANLDLRGSLRLGDNSAQGNQLNTTPSSSAPTNSLYWGSRTILDNVNASNFLPSTLTSANGGLALSSATGPITVTLDATTAGTTSTTASNSGLEIASDGLRLLGGCANTQVLSWNAGANRWECNSISSGLTGSGVATRIAFWDGSLSLASSQSLYWDNTSGRLGIGNSAPTVSLDVTGQIAVSSTASLSGPVILGSPITGTTNTVLTYESNSQISQRPIDSRVWGSTLIDSSSTHPALQLNAGSTTYLSLNGTQVLTANAIDLSNANNTSSQLLTSRGGTGIDGSTAPAGTLIIATGSGFNIKPLGGDASLDSTGTLTLANTGVAAATYGSSLGTPVITIDSKGRITSASTAPLNFEQTLTFSDGLSRSGNTITADGITTGTTSTTASNSGIEVTATGIRLLGGCSNTQVLSWDAGANRWNCTTPSSGLSGNGVATRLTFWNGSSSLASSQNLYWDNTNGRLGLGNSAPTATLDVTGDLLVSSTATVNGQLVLNGLLSGDTNNVLVVNTGNRTASRAIDSRVWGTTLIDSSSTHPALQLGGSADYLSLNGTQVLTQGAINLSNSNNTTSQLLTSRGGLGIDASTAPAGTLIIATGSGFNIKPMGGDATISSTGTLTLANTGVSAATYGSALGIPVITVDAKGRLTSASTAPLVNIFDGSGSANFLAKFSDSNTLTSGLAYDNGVQFGIGTQTPLATLDVAGAIRLGANAAQGNQLNTIPSSSAPTNSLYWGSRTLLDNVNAANYIPSTLTSANAGITLSGATGPVALTLDATTTGTTSTTASNSGLEIASDGLRLLGGCTSNQILAWDGGANRWYCSSVGGLGALAGSGAANQVTFWSGTSNLTGSNNFWWDSSNSKLGLGTTAPASRLSITSADAAALQINPFGSSAGNTGEMRFLELSANGTEYTGFKSPDSLTQSIVYTLPDTAGSSDYVLTYQNGGVLEWQDVTAVGGAGDITAVGSMTSGAPFSDSSADDDWLGLGASAGRIEFDDLATDEVNILSAVVGIGTPNPYATLDVRGAIRLGSNAAQGNQLDTTPSSSAPSNSLYWGSRTLLDNVNASNYVASTLTAGNGIILSGATGPVTITVDATTTTSTSTTASNSGLELTADGLRLLGGCSANQVLAWDDGADRWVCTSAASGTVTGSGVATRLAFWDSASNIASSQALYWNNTSGRLGIGNSAPTTTLDVTGDLLVSSTATVNGQLVLNGLLTGDTNNVLVSNAGNRAAVRAIDSRVWGSTLIDSSSTHPALQLNAGSTTYLSLNGTQVLTAGAINLSTAANITGVLPAGNGGTGIDGSTSPAGTLLIGTGSGFNIKPMGGDATISSTGTLTLANTGVSAATYGSSLGIPVITVDSKGRLTSASTAPILNILDGSGSANYLARFSDSNTLTTGLAYDNGVQFGIGTQAPLATLDVNGAIRLGSNAAQGNQLNTTPSSSAPTNSLYWGSRTLLDNVNAGNYLTTVLTAGNGITLSGSTGPVTITADATTTGTTSTTASNSGLELTASGVRMIGGCSLNQVLVWNAGADRWECNSLSGIGGITGNGVATRVAFWNGSSSLASSQSLYWDNTNGRLGIGTSSPTATLDITGQLLVSSTATVNGQLVLNGLLTGDTNTVMVLNAGNRAASRSIDSRVWGTTLVDSSSTHPALQLNAGSTTYLSLNGTQVLTANAINLATAANITGLLPAGNGGTGVDGSTSPAGTLLIGTGTGFNIKPMGGDATISSTGTLTLANTGVSAATYGSALGIPVITVDAKGRLTSASTAPLLNILDGSGTANYLARYSDSNTLTTGLAYDNGVQFGIGTAAPLATLDVRGAIRLGANAAQGNQLNTTPSSSAPTNSLYWGSRTLIDNVNASNYLPSSLTSANGGLTLSGATGPVTLTLDATTSGATSVTASNSGLEIASDGLRLIGGCSANQVLAWDSGANRWQCTSTATGTVTGTGIATRLAFWDSSNNLASNQDLYWDNTNSRLGLGTSSPTDTLTVTNNSGPSIRLGTNSQDNGIYIGSIDSNEGVLSFGAEFSHTGGAITSWTARETASGAFRVENGNLTYYANTGLTSGNTFTPLERFVITNGGNAGIGTSSPDSRLHIVGGDIYAAEDSAYTFNNGSALNDIYAQGNLEIDGTIYGSTASLGQLNIGSDIITDFVGASTGLALSGSTLTIDSTTTGATSVTASNSGLEIASDGLRLIGGCSANQVLAWDSGANRWQCTSTATGTVTGTGIATRLAFWNGSSSLASSQSLYWDNTNGRLGLGNSAPTTTLDVTGDLLVSSTATVNGQLVLNGLLSGDTNNVLVSNAGNRIASRSIDARVWGSTLIDSSSTHPALQLNAGSTTYLSLNGTQVLTASAINLATAANITGILPALNGGIGVDGSTSPAGTLVIGTGTGFNIKPMGGDASIDSTGTLTLANTGVSAATYGSALGIPVITVDSKGRLTSASTAPLLNILDGSGISNYVARFSDENTLTTGVLYDSGSNVGIGTTNPQDKLELSSASAIRLRSDISDNKLIKFYDGGTEVHFLRANYSGSGNTDNDLVFGTDQLASALVIERGGNIGIGTSSPDSKVHIDGGDLYVANSDNYTFNNASSLNDIYAQGNLEIDGTIYGTTASLGQLNIGSDIITDFVGASTGLALSGSTLTIDATTTGTTSVTASNSGLELTASGVRMLGGCSDGQILAWDSSLQTWKCSANVAEPAGTSFQVQYNNGGTMAGSILEYNSSVGSFLLSNSSPTLSSYIFDVDWSPLTSSTSPADLFKINIGSNGTLTGNAFAIYNAGSELFSIDPIQAVSNVPFTFGAAGDVSVAYDLIFTNQTSSNIKSYGPLTLESGEAFESNSLTLRTFGTGDIVMDLGSGSTAPGDLLVTGGTIIGSSAYQVGKTAPSYGLLVEGRVGIGTSSASGWPLSPLAVSGMSSSAGIAIVADGSGNFYRQSSSIRFKENIEDLETDYSKVLQLNPVSYNYKDTGVFSVGYIAEEAEELGGLPGFVIYNEAGQPEGLRYDLLGFYLKEVVKDQQITLDGLEANVQNIQSQQNTLSSTTGANNQISAQITNLEAVLGETTNNIDNLTLNVEGMTNNVNDLETRLTFIEDLIGVNQTTESTETTESSSSAGLLSGLLSQFTSLFNEFKDMFASLGISNENGTLTVSTDMNVLGNTTLNDLTITGDLVAGQIKLDTLANSLGIVGPSCYNDITQTKNNALCDVQTLYIQKELAGNIDLFNGKVLIEPDGTLTVNGTVKANTVVADEYQVKNTSQLVGSGLLSSGQTQVTIYNANVKANSKIFVTATSATNGQPLIVTQKLDSVSFTVSVEQPVTGDISFDWWILNVSNETQ